MLHGHSDDARGDHQRLHYGAVRKENPGIAAAQCGWDSASASMTFALEGALLIGAVALTSSLTSSVSVSGYVQADAILYDQSSLDEANPSTGEPLNDNRFSIRRAR